MPCLFLCPLEAFFVGHTLVLYNQVRYRILDLPLFTSLLAHTKKSILLYPPGVTHDAMRAPLRFAALHPAPRVIAPERLDRKAVYAPERP